MNQDVHHKDSKKALYVFLCSLLGMLLFVMLQKAATLLLIVFLSSLDGFSVEQYAREIYKFETLTNIIALFFGGWYGVWLGIHWYGVVYEAGRGGFFYTFWGKMSGGHNFVSQVEKPKQASSDKVMSEESGWQFDDLVKKAQTVIKGNGEWETKVQVKPKISSPKQQVARVRKSVKKPAAMQVAEPVSVLEAPIKKNARSPRKKASKKE